MWDYFAVAQPVPDAVSAEGQPQHEMPVIVPRSDNRYRQLMLPYQARYDAGRLRGRGVDHLIPNAVGSYTGIAGGNVGRPSRLSPVPVFAVAPNGTLVRAGRVATQNPSQYQTNAAFDNGILYGRAEPIRWPDA